MRISPRRWILGRGGVWRSPARRQQSLFVWLSLIPILAFFGFFMIYPIFSAFNVSLRQWRIGKPDHPFIGFQNYAWAFRDDLFWVSLKNTLIFTVGHMGLAMVLGLTLAVILFSMRQPWRGILTTVYFLPVMTLMAVAAYIFYDIFSPVTGPLNYLLRFIGLGPYNWLRSSTTAMPSVIVVTTWKYLGIHVVIFMAGLTTIPRELLEAAEIDGASKLQSFFRVMLPLLRPTLLFDLVTGTISCLKVFTEAFILGKASPGTATRTVAIHIYETGFISFDLGRASAFAFILFIIIMIIVLVELRVLREQFEY